MFGKRANFAIRIVTLNRYILIVLQLVPRFSSIPDSPSNLAQAMMNLVKTE
jgi:hypothetical protein